MTKQELINTYDSMSMPEEHVEAIEARLKKLYDNPSPSSAPEVPEESTREYKFDRKKPSAVKAAVISISAAAAAVLLVFGGRYLINGLPISSDPPLDAETEETSEPPYDTEEIRFESADDIPGYERAGCYDEYEHSLIPGADSGKAGPLFTQRLRDGKPVSVVRIKITSANSWDEMNYTEYHAVITECLSGKQLNLNISNEVTFRLGSTHSEQIIGEPSLAAGDELIAAAAEDGGEKSLVDPEELLFECFTVKGRNFAAQRHWYWLDLADNAFNHQHGDIRRITTVTDDPVSYYGIYEQGELAAALEKLVLASDEALSLGTEPLPDLYSDFTLDFGLIEPFCYYWFDENNELISIDAREDIFGNVHGLDDEDVPDVYCAGFCEDELGWYMQASNRNGGDSMYWIPKNDPEHMYRYDFGSDSSHTRSDYSERYGTTAQIPSIGKCERIANKPVAEKIKKWYNKSMNKQISLSNLEDELSQVRTKKKEFLEQIDRIVPWNEWTAMIKPCYYKGERGNKPYDLGLMLRLYLIQNLILADSPHLTA